MEKYGLIIDGITDSLLAVSPLIESSLAGEIEPDVLREKEEFKKIRSDIDSLINLINDELKPYLPNLGKQRKDWVDLSEVELLKMKLGYEKIKGSEFNAASVKILLSELSDKIFIKHVDDKIIWRLDVVQKNLYGENHEGYKICRKFGFTLAVKYNSFINLDTYCLALFDFDVTDPLYIY